MAESPLGSKESQVQLTFPQWTLPVAQHCYSHSLYMHCMHDPSPDSKQLPSWHSSVYPNPGLISLLWISFMWINISFSLSNQSLQRLQANTVSPPTISISKGSFPYSPSESLSSLYSSELCWPSLQHFSGCLVFMCFWNVILFSQL